MQIFPPPRHAGYNLGMSILFLVVGTALAVFVVWMVVRIAGRREKRPKRMMALIIVPCLYALSFGPMASLARHDCFPKWLMDPLGYFYAPLILFLNEAPEPVSAMLNWLSLLWP
jgi:hypothetical protein